MAETTIGEQSQRTPFLERTVNLTTISWTTIAWIAVVVVAVAFRLPDLGHHALSISESQLADSGYRFYSGHTTGPGNDLSNVGPVALILEAFAFFLFGASDISARIVPALLGIAMIPMVLGLRPAIGNTRALGAASLLALSPIAVYTSRIATREIFVSAFSLLVIVAFVRFGLAGQTDDARRRWALIAGAALAATFGSGPSSISVVIAIGIALGATTLLDENPDNAIRRSLAAARETKDSGYYLLIGFGFALLTLFSRLFTDFTALAGIGETVADWARLVTTASSATPTQFFLLAVLAYEIFAIVFALVAAFRKPPSDHGSLPWSVFAMWFAAALLLFSFSSGGAAEHAIHVALPVLLLGGGALGEVISELDPRQIVGGRTGLLALALVGFTIAAISEIVLLSRINDAADDGQAVFEAIATIALAVAPLGIGVYVLARADRASGQIGRAGATVLLAAAIFLGAYTLRSSIMLSFYNAGKSTELLAQKTSTRAVDQIVRRVTNLSRDTTLDDGSARDPEGGHGLTIAIDRSVQWPYRWYFRDFPDAEVWAVGQTPLSGAQVLIAPDETGMAEAGYGPRAFPTINRVPSTYLAPEFGTILRSIFFPNRWEDGARYLLFRTMSTTAEPETVTIGLVGELANRIVPDTGPFGLYEKIGAGNGRGQFNQPRGIAVSPDGEQIFVVDMGNARIEYFDALGTFIDSWGDSDSSDLGLAKTDSGLGPTGIAVGPDGLIYVADTWDHRVVILDNTGRIVREFGQFADTADAPEASVEQGSFFGPRAIAIANDEIYVVDTGNERVQVFGLDGTFIRAFGGAGSLPDQLLEPVGIAIDADGRVFVADSGNARISVFSSTGVALEQWPVDAWNGNQYFEPYLAFDDAGLLYASSSSTSSVEVYDPTGTLVLAIHQVGADQLDQPVGLAWTPEGSLLITDKGRNAVFRYTPIVESVLPVDDGTGSLEEELAASPVASPVVDEGIPEEQSSPASPAASPMASPFASPVASRRASPIASPTGSPTPRPTSTPIGNG